MSNTHYVRCHANSRASINKWSDMQQKGLPRFTVHFENLNATMYIIDDIIEKDVLLHNGLDIVLVFNDYQNENVEIDVRGLTNQILDIFYFITMASCELDKINAKIIFNNDNTVDGELSVLSDQEVNVSVPRNIDTNALKLILENRDKLSETDRDIVSRALAWLRASILQETVIFRFMCLFISIETLKLSLNKNIYINKKEKDKREKNWRAIFNIVEKSPIDVDLNLIINARDHLLHSLGDISEEFISEIDKYLEPLRIIAIHGIGQMLDLDSKLIETVSSKKPLRMFKVTASVYKGRFENLNNDIEWLLNNLPEFKVHENPRKYHLDDEGNPVVDINFSTTARFADNVKFTPYSWHMIGVKDAGIKPISFTFNE